MCFAFTGDCPAGWFQAGTDEFKSCFLFVGAVSTYKDALATCQVQNLHLLIFLLFTLFFEFIVNKQRFR